MPRKIKIGTEVAHVTTNSDTAFKVKRSRSSGCSTHRSVNASGSCSGERGNVLTVAVCTRGRLGGARRFGANIGRRGAGHIVAAARPQLVLVYHLACKNVAEMGADMFS